jgi:hypothetical protein
MRFRLEVEKFMQRKYITIIVKIAIFAENQSKSPMIVIIHNASVHDLHLGRLYYT